MYFKRLLNIVLVFKILAFLSGCSGSGGNGNNEDVTEVEYLFQSDDFLVPAQGVTSVSTATPIIIHNVNIKVKLDTLLNGGFVLLGDSPVVGTISFEPENRRIVFLPDESLKVFTLYRATLTTTLEDIDGRRLENDFSWSFTTGRSISKASFSADGIYTDGDSFRSEASDDGRIVVFQSSAQNIVLDDTNNKFDIFVHNLETGESSRVSVNSDGSQRALESSLPVISGDGRFVAFYSDAYFVHELASGLTTRVDVLDPAAMGSTAYVEIGEYPAISDDGRYIAFQSEIGNLTPLDTKTTRDIFRRDTLSNTTILISVSSGEVQSNSHSYSPSISGDGRYVAFSSIGTSLVSGDTNGVEDVFVRDIVSGETTRASVAAGGIIQANAESSNPVVSFNGRYVAFNSSANNLVPNDNNEENDVFVYDYLTKITNRVSLDESNGEFSKKSILSDMSADGRYIVFTNKAETTVGNRLKGDMYVYDNFTGLSSRVVNGTELGGTYPSTNRSGAISVDGTYLTYTSDDPYLVANDNFITADVFRMVLRYP